MPDAYEVYEGRYLNEYYAQSGVAGLYVGTPVVPAGKVWTILSAAYYPSASETKTVYWYVLGKSLYTYPITQPVSIALASTIPLPALTMGNEIKIFPGESLVVIRDSATAGSTMTIVVRYIESDLPLYSYIEPQKKAVSQVQRRGSVYAQSGSISESGGSGGSPPPPPIMGGRRGVPEPI